jgi:long-subunit fatty acid transport protein
MFMGMRLRGLLAIMMCVSSAAAMAGLEKPINFGARAAGMGGVATAYNNNISAVFYNPALTKYIKTWAVGVDLLPSVTAASTTLATGTQNSKIFFLPIFNMGFGYRFSDLIIAGIGVNSPAGLATRYENFPVGGINRTINVDFKVIEAAPFVTFEVAPGVALSVQYRAAYALFNEEISGALKFNNISGTNFLGARAGFAHAINPNWHWGLQVRSETQSTLKGTTDITALGVTGATTHLRDVRYPWEFMGGLAYVADEERWSIGMDIGYRLYSRLSKLDFDVDAPAGASAAAVAALAGNETLLDITLNSNDSFIARLGGEVKFAEEWFGRLGTSMVTPTTNKSLDSPVLTTPGIGINAGTGIGYKTKTWGVDMSYDINFANANNSTVTLGGVVLAANRTRSGVAHALGLSFNYFGG